MLTALRTLLFSSLPEKHSDLKMFPFYTGQVTTIISNCHRLLSSRSCRMMTYTLHKKMYIAYKCQPYCLKCLSGPIHSFPFPLVFSDCEPEHVSLLHWCDPLWETILVLKWIKIQLMNKKLKDMPHIVYVVHKREKKSVEY